MHEYTITPARYAKGKLVLRSPPSDSGWKTKIQWLAENCGGRWVHRDKGYQMSPRQAANFETLLKAGFEGGIRVGVSQPASFTLKETGLQKFTLKEALNKPRPHSQAAGDRVKG